MSPPVGGFRAVTSRATDRSSAGSERVVSCRR
ncbi:MAG: hypothetical protein ACFWTS_03350 [Pseudoclavibacter caeni]|nr:hypothetical protein [Pseudoclavibacter caeni]